jgi:hypothetical protein
MKMSQFIFAAALAVFAVGAGNASAQSQTSATVTKIHGAARYSYNGGKWQTLHEGNVLKPGAVIQTAQESFVDIVLGGNEVNTMPAVPVIHRFTYGFGNADAQQNVVRLRENTVLAIDKLYMEQTGADVVTDTQLDLRAGTVFGNVKKLSAASKYEVKLPNGVAGIRGTIYEFTANGTLTAYFGSFVASYYDKFGKLVTKVVGDGQTLDLNTGEITTRTQAERDAAKDNATTIIGVVGITPITLVVPVVDPSISPTIHVTIVSGPVVPPPGVPVQGGGGS